MFPKTSLETTAIEGVISKNPVQSGQPRISNLIPSFLKYAQYELCLSGNTVKKYQESLGWVIRDLGDLEVEALTPGHFTELKQKMTMRGSGRSHKKSSSAHSATHFRYTHDQQRL